MLKFKSPKRAGVIAQSQTQIRTWTASTRTQYPRLKPRKPIPFLGDLKQLHDPEQALSFFHQYARMGFKHDYPSYSCLLYKLARSRNFKHIDPLLAIIQSRNVRCQESLFIGLMRHYGKCGLVERAIELFHQMPRFNCERSLQSFNTLLNVLVANDRFSDADDFFGRSKELGFRPNAVSFNIMMKGWLERGELENACRVFDEMLEREVQPTAVTYNSLIGFLCRKGEVEKAMRLFEDTTRKGHHPNAVTYALLMEGLCSLGKYNDAKKMMFDMEYRGCKPKLINFGVLMTDLAQRGKFDEAKSLLLEMKKKKLKPDVVIYNIFVNFLCKERRAEEAYKVLVDMQIKGCEPNAATYRMLVDGFCQVEEYERALSVLHAMLMSRHCPQIKIFTCLVVGLMKRGKTDDACFVLEEMEKRNMRFQLVSWETLVKEVCDCETSHTTDELDRDFNHYALPRLILKEYLLPCTSQLPEMEGSFSPIVKKIAEEVGKRKREFGAPTRVCLEDLWLSKPNDRKGIAVGGCPIRVIIWQHEITRNAPMGHISMGTNISLLKPCLGNREDRNVSKRAPMGIRIQYDNQV